MNNLGATGNDAAISPYRHFSRAEWASLRADTPLAHALSSSSPSAEVVVTGAVLRPGTDLAAAERSLADLDSRRAAALAQPAE